MRAPATPDTGGWLASWLTAFGQFRSAIPTEDPGSGHTSFSGGLRLVFGLSGLFVVAYVVFGGPIGGITALSLCIGRHGVRSRLFA